MILNPYEGLLIKVPFYSTTLFQKLGGLNDFENRIKVPTFLGFGLRIVGRKNIKKLHQTLKPAKLATYITIAFLIYKKWRKP